MPIWSYETILHWHPCCSHYVVYIHIKMDFAQELFSKSWMQHSETEFYNLIYFWKYSPCTFLKVQWACSMRTGFEFAFLWPIFFLPFLLLCNTCHCTLSSQSMAPEWVQKKWATAFLSTSPLPTPFIYSTPTLPHPSSRSACTVCHMDFGL